MYSIQHLSHRRTLVSVASVAAAGSIGLFAAVGFSGGGSGRSAERSSIRPVAAEPQRAARATRTEAAGTVESAPLLHDAAEPGWNRWGWPTWASAPTSGTQTPSTLPAGRHGSGSSASSGAVPSQIVVTMPSRSGGRNPSVGTPTVDRGTPPSVSAGWKTTVDLGTLPTVTPGAVDPGSVGTINPPTVATR